MQTRLFSILLLLITMSNGLSQDRYDQVRIWSENTSATINELLRLGIDPEGLEVRPGVYVDVILDQREKEQVLDLGLTSEDLIVDLSAYYESRLTQGLDREFGYGSMGGYYTLDEVIAFMDSLHVEFPQIISAKDSIGSSYEGRAIWAFKISDNHEVDEDEPELFYNSLIHAREPAAMMTIMHYAWQLADNYNVDPIMTYLVNEREMWFVPVINPDGYAFNEFTNPNGGGMQRKNRRPGCASSPGVDLNRNWGFQWGYDDIGSSSDACGATYRGTSAFSEPETQAIRDFVREHDFQTVFNYHSYGNLLIRPFGYNPDQPLPEPEGATYMELGPDLVTENNYLFGTGIETVGYTTNGDAVDYMFGELGIINFTPEVGAWAEGGFWPPTDMIYELAEENLSMNIHLAGVAGNWIRLENLELLTSDPIEYGSIVPCQLNVRNKGLGTETRNVTLHLSSPDESIIPSVASFDLSELAPQTSIDLGLSGLTFEVQTEAGELAQLVLSINVEDQYTIADTFFWSIGGPDTVFTDGLEAGFGLWSSDSWDIVSDAYEGALAMNESPSGNYSALSTLEVELTSPIDLRGYTTPVLNFVAKWDIEINYDFCQVVASDDGGATWTALAGEYTVLGNGATVQPIGEPGYHGIQDWVEETISLDAYADQPSVLIGFRLLSDTLYEGDGFVVDNIIVRGWGLGFHPGDITRDGLIDIADGILLLLWIIENEGLEGDALELSDLNMDSNVDVMDMILLVEIILFN
ncbi:immune inhibitor A [bacterium]|nr:immune inhibitor A [bacterium]